mgnify:CR=1 FL=1
MIDYGRLKAEMMTVKTVAERKAIWDRAQNEAADMQRWVAEQDSANIERHWREQAIFDALPWHRRIGRRRP